MRRAGWLVVVMVAASACTFPDVQIVDPAHDSSSGDAVDDVAVDDSGDATVKPDVAVDGDATTVVDADAADTTQKDTQGIDVIDDVTIPDVTPDAASCDQDKDGYQRGGGTCHPDTSAIDCDDLNPLAFPGEGAYISAKPPKTMPLAGDWNCDGVVDKQYTAIATCAGLAIGCNTRGGIKADAPCGGEIVKVDCVLSGIGGCADGTTSAATMGCK